MKTVTCLLAMCLALAAMPAMAATKVFLLGGQSNMAGVGGYDTNGAIPAPYNLPQPAVQFWNYLGAHANGNGGSGYGNGWTDLQGGFGYPGYSMSCFGPEVSFGYRLHQLFPNDDIYLVKYGVSSTNLAVDWNPDGSGAYYTTFKVRARAAMQNLTTAGLSPTIAGMIWMQGDNDAIDPTRAAAYETNLTNFIAKVRSDFATPDMRFVLGQITTYYDTTPPGGNATVRDAQMAVAGEVSNVACFDTLDLQLAYVGHYGTQGQIDLGIRFANEFVQTPEPSTLILAGAGLLSLAGYCWRKRRS